MFFVDLTTGSIVDSSGEKVLHPPHFTGFQQEEFEFSFLTGGNLYVLPENSEIVILADVAEHYNSPIFTATGTIAADRTSVIFSINTSTVEFNQRVKASNTPCIVDICLRSNSSGHSQRLIRFSAVADRQLLPGNLPPEPLKNYYNSEQIDALFAARELDITADQITAVMLEHNAKPYADLSFKRENSHYKVDFSIAIPAGSPGTDGYSPQRGVDYWTAEDIAAIKEHVETVILNGAW